jgi:Glycosyl hydrolases family 2, TIM barrel domain/Glycosyl hydrolases family 2/Glycosyl hydrolases family 2, sugar binding domain
MINRRSFLTTLGASAFLPNLSSVGHSQTRFDDNSCRSRMSLNGEWERYVHGEFYEHITVPSSHPPIGLYTLKRNFLLPRLATGERAYIHFEAITYFARVSVNGTALGDMGPYVPYDFEFTSQAREGSNHVEVTIADLRPFDDGAGKDELALGVNPGWEAYGGIIRDVYIELRPASFIENVRFGYEFNSSYGQALCRAQVYLSHGEAFTGEIEVALLQGETVISHGIAKTNSFLGAQEVEVTFTVQNPALWSPEAPHLYELRARVLSGKKEDTWKCRTGLREVRTEGREFLLNGKRLVLNGVCRHDMWKDQGFTLSRNQQQQDMKMIKALGCNFARLVHYPHDRHIIELADELGLLVTEEPGYWIMDFHTMPRGEIELGYRIMEKTIRRDWNSPSVFAWLLANECKLTVEVLKEGKERCNRLDPIRRLVSAANDRPKEQAKSIFEEAGMDFFDQHPYTFDMDRFEIEADFMGPSKPLTFTEWGGKAVGQSEPIMRATVDRMLDLIEEGKLSGHSFWSWQDVRQYCRVDAEMNNGILESGVVTEGREPRASVYMELERLIERRRHEHISQDTEPAVLPLRHIPWMPSSKFHTIDLNSYLQNPEAQKSWREFENRMAQFWPKNSRTSDQWKRTGEKFQLWEEANGKELQIAEVPFHFAVVDGFIRPLVGTNVSELAISLPPQCGRLHILGNITLPTGYPCTGKQGDVVAVYTVYTHSGSRFEIPLRSGYEVVSANRIHEGTRIEPLATGAQPALLYRKDFAREQYQVLLYSTPKLPESSLAKLTCKVLDNEQVLAIFAITAEQFSS